MEDAASLARLVSGVDVVIHAAGAIKARSRAEFLSVNSDGARRMAEAVVAAGAPRLILISSLAAREPDLSDYAASKRAGEIAASEVLGGALCILRPPAIYGPGDRETLPLFVGARRSPILPLLAPEAARLALAHVDEVVETIANFVERPLQGSFAVAGAQPEGYSWREILTTAAEVSGRRPILAQMPVAGVRLAGAASESLARLRSAPTIFGRGKVRELLHLDWSVAEAEAAPETHRARPRPLAEGFAQTADWYASRGWL